MSVFRKMTWRTLRLNPVRTLVTIVGIILSAAMFTAVASMVSSLLGYEVAYETYTDGSWHVAFYGLTQEQMDEVSQDELVEQTARFSSLGYVETESEGSFYLQLCAVDQTYLDHMPVYLTQGRLPESSGEVLLPEPLLESYQLGDTLTLALNQLTEEGNLEETGQASCTVVGVYSTEYCGALNMGTYDLLTLWDGEETGNLFVTLNKPSRAYSFGAAYFDQLQCSVSYNAGLLAASGSFRNSGYVATYWELGAILAAIILLGSVSLIYNAFSISLSERTRQFGILNSVGATRKQLNRSVLWEALFVGGIGIPLGILAGLGGIGLTLFLLRDKFETTFNLSQDIVPMCLRFNWETIVIALVISVVTVLISAWLPARRATRMTAIQAIRQSGDVKLREKDVKVSPLTKKLFGLEGLLARKNFKRNRKRYRATVLSLTISVVLLLSAWTFTGIMTKANTSVSTDYDVYATCLVEEVQELESLAAQLQGQLDALETVDSSQVYGYVYSTYIRMEDLPLTTDAFPVYYPLEEDDETVEAEEEIPCGNVYIFAVPDQVFSDYLTGLGIDPEPYFTSEAPVAVLCDQWKGYLNDTYTVTSTLAEAPEQVTIYTGSNSIQDMASGYVAQTLDIGDMVEEGLMGTIGTRSIGSLYVPLSRLNEWIGEMGYEVSVDAYCQAKDHRAATEDIQNLSADLYVYDEAESNDTINNLLFIIDIFCGGFIALMVLISVANVFNTISTSIALRRREFAMLRSVGLTGGGFNRMMCYESLLYGAKALLYGLPLGWLLALLMLWALSSSYVGPAYWPFLPSVVCIFGVFLTVAVSILYAARKLKKENLIDALKNENM